MCLYPTHKRPKRATKNITVYKWLEKMGKDYYTSPYMHFRFVLGLTNKGCLKDAKQYLRNTGVIGPGVFHAFVKERQPPGGVHGGSVLKAVIPKDSYYWLGEDGDIAATALRVIKPRKKVKK
jgi:hypothetical protein